MTPDDKNLKPVMYCRDFDEVPNCCSHCHDDDEDGFDSLSELYDGKGHMAIVCCKVGDHLTSIGSWDV